MLPTDTDIGWTFSDCSMNLIESFLRFVHSVMEPMHHHGQHSWNY